MAIISLLVLVQLENAIARFFFLLVWIHGQQSRIKLDHKMHFFGKKLTLPIVFGSCTAISLFLLKIQRHNK